MPVYQERPGISTLKQFLNSLKQTSQTEQQRNKQKDGHKLIRFVCRILDSPNHDVFKLYIYNIIASQPHREMYNVTLQITDTSCQSNRACELLRMPKVLTNLMLIKISTSTVKMQFWNNGMYVFTITFF